jgi:hypothetical protein
MRARSLFYRNYIMTFWLSNRLVKQLATKAAGEKQPEEYPLGYVESCFDLRTPLEGCFNSRQVVTC